MRISDWSSDVCSSDLQGCRARRLLLGLRRGGPGAGRSHEAAGTLLPLPPQGRRRPPPDGELTLQPARYTGDRKSAGLGKSVSVRVDLGGRRLIKKKTKQRMAETNCKRRLSDNR